MESSGQIFKRQAFDLMEYWRVIVKRRGVLFVFAATVFFLMGIYSFLAPPKYKPYATLMIGEETSKILNIEDEFGQMGYRSQMRDLMFLNTQLTLLKSESLAERVARVLDLTSKPEFSTSKKSLVRMVKDLVTFKWLRSNSEASADSELYVDPNRRIAEALQKKIDVVQIRDTKVLKISYISTNRALATQIVNKLAEEFIDFSIEKRSATTEQATGFLSEQIESLRQDLAVKEGELQQYGKDKELFFLSESESSSLSELRGMTQAYTQAVIDRINAEAEYRALKDSTIDSLPRTTENRIIQDLEEEYTQMKNQYQQNLQKYKPDFPTMLELRSKIESMRDELRNEVENAVKLAESSYREALRSETALEAQVKKQREKVSETGSNEILYNSLNIEIENMRNQLGALEEMKNQTQVSARLSGIKTTNISIIDRAKVPENPVSPKKALNMILALFLGIFGGIGLCFVFEYLDNSVKGPEDVEKISGLPSLGVVPYLALDSGNEKKKRKKYASLGHAYGDENTFSSDIGKKINEIELINFHHPRLTIAEDYRTIRTSILLSQVDDELKRIAFVSSLPGEGKTATLANMAVAFAQMGRTVLIIDADLRKPHVHEIFHVRNQYGLSGYLSGSISIKGAVKKTNIDKIWLLPTGVIPPNPSELLNSNKMKLLLEEISKGFDIVLVDTPPVLAVVDAQIVCTLVDGVVLVVEPEKTPRRPFLQAVEAIRQSKSKLLGVVFNRAKITDRHNFSKYYYRTSYSEKSGSADN